MTEGSIVNDSQYVILELSNKIISLIEDFSNKLKLLPDNNYSKTILFIKSFISNEVRAFVVQLVEAENRGINVVEQKNKLLKFLAYAYCQIGDNHYHSGESMHYSASLSAYCDAYKFATSISNSNKEPEMEEQLKNKVAYVLPYTYETKPWFLVITEGSRDPSAQIILGMLPQSSQNQNGGCGGTSILFVCIILIITLLWVIFANGL